MKIGTLRPTSINGIQMKQSANGKVSYSGTYRDPITKKSKRKVVLTKNSDLKKYHKEALYALNEFKANLKNINSVQVIENEYQNFLTLNQLADFYFEDRKKKTLRLLKEQFTDLSEDEFNNHTTVFKKLLSIKTEKYRYNKHVRNHNISDIPSNRITKQNITKYIEDDLGTSPIGPKSKFNIVSKIKTIYNFAIKKELIEIVNPFLHIEFKNPKNQRDRVLSLDEIKLLLDSCKAYKQNINVYLSVYLAVLTGGRATTVLNVRKKDIDTKNGIIHLYNFKASRKYKLKLNPEAIDWFERKILHHYEDNEYLLRALQKGKRISPPTAMKKIPEKVFQIMDELFNKKLNKQNNSDRDNVVNFHTIRRSIATNLAMSGTTLYNVMIFLNHASIEQTMQYLNMTHNDLNKDQHELLGNIFNIQTA